MRVEVFDGGGNRYTVTFEGNVTRDKALRLLDLVELLGGMPGANPTGGNTATEFCKFDKVRLIVERHFPVVWFSARDVQTVFEQELKEPISLSTVSTYLSRMINRGFLVRSGAVGSWRYRAMTQTSQNMLSLIKSDRQ